VRLRTVFAWGLIGVATLAVWLPRTPARVERSFSRAAYPHVQRALTGASNLVPFSWLDGAVAVAVVGLGLTVWTVVSRRGDGGGWRWLFRWCVVGAAVYVAFLACWGLNYRREPLRSHLDFERARVTDTNVRVLADRAVAEVNAARREMDSVGPPPDSLQGVADTLAQPFAAVCGRLGLPVPRLARPKVPVLTVFFNRAGVSGMTNPLGLETLVASDLLPFERPVVIAHEWGHLAGLGPESEAAFLGTVTCMRGDVRARYSAWLDVTMRVLGQVPDDARRVLVRNLSPRVLRDIRGVMARNERERVRWVSMASWRVYDRYLKANSVAEGVRSYDEVTTLLVGTGFDETGMPRVRILASRR
jgi:hypothetical protein